MLTLSGLISNGQGPIQPHVENGYTAVQQKTFATSSTKLSVKWRKEYIAIINKGLAKAGETVIDQNDNPMVLDESHVEWCIDNSFDSTVTGLTNFKNSRKSGDTLKFFSDPGPWSGTVRVFHYGKCRIITNKNVCMNLIKVPQVFQEIVQQQVPDTMGQVVQIKTDTAQTQSTDLGQQVVGNKQQQQTETQKKLYYVPLGRGVNVHYNTRYNSYYILN